MLVGGFVAAMVGAHGFAGRRVIHAPRLGMRRRHPPVPSNADGAGVEDRGRGGRQGRKAVPRM